MLQLVRQRQLLQEQPYLFSGFVEREPESEPTDMDPEPAVFSVLLKDVELHLRYLELHIHLQLLVVCCRLLFLDFGRRLYLVESRNFERLLLFVLLGSNEFLPLIHGLFLVGRKHHILVDAVAQCNSVGLATQLLI